jgi:hypothetical protein
MMTTTRLDAIESQVARLTAPDAFFAKNFQHLHPLPSRPIHLPTDWFCIHGREPTAKIEVTLRKKFVGFFPSLS